MTHAADADAVRRLAREAHDEAVADRALVEALRAVDAVFDARVEAAAALDATATPKLVTPWPDLAAVFAATAAFGAAAAAGRIIGGTLLEDPGVVAVTAVIASVAAVVLLGVGVAVAVRERPELRAQRYDSRAVMRAGFTVASAVLAVGTAVAMAVRLVVERVTGLPVLALVCSVLLAVIAFVIAVGARREAGRGVAEGRLLHRPGGDAAGRVRAERRAASESARDQAAAVLQRITDDERERIGVAYGAEVERIAARAGVSDAVASALRSSDALTSRYRV